MYSSTMTVDVFWQLTVTAEYVVCSGLSEKCGTNFRILGYWWQILIFI